MHRSFQKCAMGYEWAKCEAVSNMVKRCPKQIPFALCLSESMNLSSTYKLIAAFFRLFQQRVSKYDPTINRSSDQCCPLRAIPFKPPLILEHRYASINRRNFSILKFQLDTAFHLPNDQTRQFGVLPCVLLPGRTKIIADQSAATCTSRNW